MKRKKRDEQKRERRWMSEEESIRINKKRDR